MKKETVKIYQSNCINLLMQFDTKYDKPYSNPFQRDYCIGKAGNELYISVRPSQNYQGDLTLDDFAFTGTTHRLLTYIRELYTLRVTEKLDFSVKDYMVRCGLKDVTQARRQLERDLFALLSVIYSSQRGRAAILDSYEMHHGRVYAVLNQGFINEMEKQNYFLLPMEYYRLDRKRYNYAPALLYYMVMLKYFNEKKTNRNRVSIRSLLAYGKFPSIQAVRATSNNSIRGRIVEPFFRNLNALSSVARFKFYDEHKHTLTQQEVQSLPYDDMLRVIIHIEWK